jgi:hypothetical protein
MLMLSLWTTTSTTNVPTAHVCSISIFRLPNAIFELRIHLHLPFAGSAASAAGALAVADVELTPNGEYLVVTGSVRPSVATGTGADPHGCACAKTGLAEFHPDAHGTLVWTDQPFGRFGRNVSVGLNPGTEVCPTFIMFVSAS